MSKIEVNTVDVQCGSTLTLGSSGKTVTLATGASQSGFGRTGTVDWCTTVKTSPLTAVSGNGYFINTCGGAVTVTLPTSPSAGDIVSIKDYKGTAGTNAITVGRGGSKIAGGCGTCGNINTDNAFVTLVYVDGTQGWLPTDDSNSDISGALSYITATGGTITTSGDYKIHTFNSDATFTVCTAGAGGVLQTNVSYMVVAGGGGGGAKYGGGGGAGGYREAKVSGDPYTASPLDAGTGITVTAQGYPLTVGSGGAGGCGPSGASLLGTNGSNSIFSTITSAGGGAGTGDNSPGTPAGAADGGSGGGSSYTPITAQPFGGGGAGNTPATPVAQGTAGGDGGGDSAGYSGGGGGGATVAGTAGNNPGKQAGPGGTGATTSINATPTARAGGGGGGANAQGPGTVAFGTGGTGGGGAGGPTPGGNGVAGTVNTGGGGGGASAPGNPDGGTGGSGVVIIRYKFQ